MILSVNPVNSLKGRVLLPASKSYSIRAAIIAGCGGASRIFNPSDCDDAKVAFRIVEHLRRKAAKATINVGESGTVLRFLLPLLALRRGEFTVVGEGTLKGRPNHHLLNTLRSRNVDVKGVGPKESIPIRISGGTFTPGKIEIDGSLSSQFVSALLIACPQLAKPTDLVIQGKEIVSRDYVDMTLAVLKKSGIKIQKKSARHFHIPGKQKFKGLKDFVVPSDYGLAAFLFAAGILVRSDITLAGHWNDALLQADGRILQFLRRMGVNLKRTDGVIKIKGPLKLKGGNFSLKDCPDLVPIMAVLALFAKGPTQLTDIFHARAKESDRISDLRRELLKVGADVKENNNKITINPRLKYRSGVLLDPHHDHRLAMAFVVLGLRIGTKVKNIECVSKSYPGFIKDVQELSGKVSVRVH
jgi:3-phosphoshikimate 1-carboxyvinyltransferase